LLPISFDNTNSQHSLGKPSTAILFLLDDDDDDDAAIAAMLLFLLDDEKRLVRSIYIAFI
jgi:hypothetical protein